MTPVCAHPAAAGMPHAGEAASRRDRPHASVAQPQAARPAGAVPWIGSAVSACKPSVEPTRFAARIRSAAVSESAAESPGATAGTDGTDQFADWSRIAVRPNQETTMPARNRAARASAAVLLMTTTFAGAASAAACMASRHRLRSPIDDHRRRGRPPPGRSRRRGRADHEPAEFCRVALTLAPTADSSIRVEVWLPTADWTGRYLGHRRRRLHRLDRANAPAPSRAACRPASRPANHRHGHGAGDDDRSRTAPPRRPAKKWLDFGSRSTHEMTVVGKILAARVLRAVGRPRLLQRVLDRRPPGPRRRHRVWTTTTASTPARPGTTAPTCTPTSSTTTRRRASRRRR